MMSEQTSPPPPDWPKRPILDYTKDDDRVSICLGNGPPEAPNNIVYHVSRLRLAYHSPRFRKLSDEDVSSRGFGFCEISKFWRDKPDIFGHIVQYVNTGSIIIPTHVAHNTLLSACNECSPSSIEKRYKAGLSLSTLVHIWYLADFLMMPHCQNVTIDHMYRLLCHIATHSRGYEWFYDGSPLIINEFIDALQIAVTAESTMAGGINQVLLLLEEFLACHSTYHRWTREQKDLVPRSVLEGAMFVVRERSAEQRRLTNELPEDIREATVRIVGEFFVHDNVDKGCSFHDLSVDFDFDDISGPHWE
ncbi:uncharacterized protein EAE98_002059 [Botrytis deweyae]|uniref:BTB domain-containing protein n=1 Tax=Botrytis deweyae TaxID=2478750 RepID=A0ABQ7IW44_9HELO|nr:uncharacterized protein EAE98_002059 [Botrytis deweyae]KAF7935839.1 hypothetical protein EAE98_002059 [Botrytis deweyae]